ncbi:MAG: M23 family metallopeptidase [Caldilineaceae bacterium]
MPLLFYLLTPSAALAQDGPPVNGGWPAGVEYTVQPGDTLLSVSLEIGLDVEQVGCLLDRSFDWDQPLVIGQRLKVPPLPFLCHRVQGNDTLSGIANRYGVTVADIVAEPWNQTGEQTRVRFLRIPLARAQPVPVVPRSPQSLPGGTGGEFAAPAQLPLPANWPYGSGHFAWPVYGWITQGYQQNHSGIDVGAWAGTPVTAADRGVVIRAGWSAIGYGNFVVIDHKIDYLTLYAHLSEILVTEGQVVAQGQLIGYVGSTGNSTGPHLHFEIRDFGRRVNPLDLLGN